MSLGHPPAQAAAGTLPIKRASHIYLLHEGRMLLVHERMDDGSIFYGLPGGKALAGESLKTAAIRQMRYETGLRVSNLRFISLLEGEILRGTSGACFAIFGRFAAEFSGDFGEFESQDPEVVGHSWVALEDLQTYTRFGPPPEYEERPELIWRPTQDFIRGIAKPYYTV